MKNISQFQSSRQNQMAIEMAKQIYQFKNFQKKSSKRLLPDIYAFDRNLQLTEQIYKNMSKSDLDQLSLNLQYNKQIL